jgi:hypothetical protein
LDVSLSSTDWEKTLYVLQKLPPEIQDIAWKAQSRLTAQYRRLSHRGKKKTAITTAIARELSAFMWDIARRTMPAPQLKPSFAPIGGNGINGRGISDSAL